MLLWLSLAILTAAVLAMILRPLFAAGDALEGAVDPALAVYRDQLDELERDRTRGLIGDREAEAARNEIARRLLGTKMATTPPAMSGRGYSAGTVRRLAASIALLAPLVAAISYISVGSPGYQGKGRSEQAAIPIERQRIDELVAKVEARLREHPQDGRGWDVIGPVYLRSGRYADAADAFTRAMALLGENPQRLAGFAEASVLAANGVVTEPARKAYEKLAQLEPNRIEPKFWLALAAEQDGKLDVAAKAYEGLLVAGEPNAPWRAMVQERLSSVRARRQPSGQPQSPPAASSSTTTSPAVDTPGPSAAEVAAAERRTPDERRQMIEGMVTSLAERLSRDGKDLAGWQRLIRAYMVLGRRNDAVSALERARGALKDEAAALDALGALARSLGLS